MVTLRVSVPYDAARIPSICHLIPSATLFERELGEMIESLPTAVYDCMPAFMDALDHPETADLDMLAAVGDGSQGKPSFWRSTGFRAVALAIAILAFMIFLAVLLQSLRS